jgi:putative ABC transport system substrate-binding protein
MRRRDFGALLAGAFVLRPQAGRAQERKRLVGFLSQGSEAATANLTAAFRGTLASLGFGPDTLAIENRWADGYPDRMPGLAAELVKLSPDILMGSSDSVAFVLRAQTTTIPIVFALGDDPVGTGLVVSLAHPGGNVTGLSFAGEETAGRELQLLKTMVPAARRVGVLTNPNSKSAAPIVAALQRAAASLQTEVFVAKATTPPDIEPAFAALKQAGVDGLIVLGDGLFTVERKHIVALAARDGLPAIYHDHIDVEDGGLMSYGGDFADNYRGAAAMVAKILTGAKPADLPVQEPAKFYLYINRKTADMLGLTIPSLLEIQADKIVE